MTRAQRVASFIAAAALVGVVTGIATAPRATPATAPPIADASQSRPHASTAGARGAHAAAASTLPEMPEAGASLASAYGVLATRAESGDTTAAKRLVAELDACRGLRALERSATETELRIRKDRRQHDAVYATSVARDLSAFEARAVEVRADIASRRRLCDRVDDDRLGELGHWIYRVAELGDAKAAQRFASGTWIEDDEVSLIDDGAIAFWRAHALDMAKRALANGELSASVEIAQAYQGVPGLAWIPPDGGIEHLGDAIERDPLRSAAYLRVATMIGYCEDCYVYAMQMESDFRADMRVAARAEAERICAIDLPSRCTHTNEYLAR